MTENNSSGRNNSAQLPRIEVTQFNENGEGVRNSESTNGNTRLGVRRMAISSSRICRRKNLTRLLRVQLFTVIPHIVFGSSMVTIGYIASEIFGQYDNGSANAKHTEIDPLNASNPLMISSLKYKKDLAERNIRSDAYDQLYKRCSDLICGDFFSLLSIGIGCIFILCGISGFLMTRHTMKEYVHCHFLWLSLSAFFSVIFITSSAMGLRKKDLSEGLLECIYVGIASSSFEIAFSLLDLYSVSYHLTKRQRQDQQRQRSSQRETGRGSEEALSREENENANQRDRNQPNLNSTQRTSGGRNSPGMRNRRHATGQGYHGRRRRSGQAGIRDRAHLYPGYHPPGARGRSRRRPMLRAQNHYVLVPTAYGRPRAVSRATRSQNSDAASQRNRGDVPMFVIANHDRYVQELNQSMENLETGTNRGSVPGDAFPLINTKNETVEKTRLQKSKSADTALSVHSQDGSRITPAFLANSSLRQYNDSSVNQSSPSINQPHSEDQRPDVQLRRKPRDHFGYSVVIKSKEMATQSHHGNSAANSFRSKSDNDSSLQISTGSSSPSFNLARNSARIASITEDSVFNRTNLNHPGSSSNIAKRKCSAGSQKAQNEAAGFTVPPATRRRFHDTASDSDFSNLASTSDGTESTSYGRKAVTSVSSDSGIGEAAGGSIVPVHETSIHVLQNHILQSSGVPERVEMKEFGLQNVRLSPVSTTTPSYENLTAVSAEQIRNFIF